VKAGVRLTLLMLLAGALVAAPVVPAHAAKKRTCKRAKSKTVKQNRYARVFTREGDGTTFDRRLFGCLRSRGKAIKLDERFLDPEFGSDFGDVKLSRRFVAYRFLDYDQSCKADCPPDYDGDDDQVVVRDLRRKVSRRIHIGGPARDVFVGPFGGVAWTREDGEVFDLYIRNRGGLRTVQGIDPGSARRRGNRIHYTRNGAEESRRLGRY
jgi:hypothetical protein